LFHFKDISNEITEKMSNSFQIINKLTVPSLQGTLAKHSKPTLQPNFAKEPFCPSRSNVGLRDSANMIDK